MGSAVVAIAPASASAPGFGAATMCGFGEAGTVF